MSQAFKPGLLLIYFSRFVSNTGDWAYLVALTVIMAQGNNLGLTLIWLIRSLVPVGVRFIAGTIADKWGYKKTAIIVDVLRCLLTASIPWFLHSAILFLLVFLVSGLSPLFTASLTPMSTEMTTLENRHQVNSVLTTVTTAGLFLGPSIGGLLLRLGANYPFYFEAVTFFVSAIAIAFLKVGREQNKTERKALKPIQLWFDFREATSIIFSVRLIRIITICGFILLLGGGAIDAYEVLFITHALHLGPASYALVVTIGGLSFILGGILNSIITKWVKTSMLYRISLVIGPLANILFSLSWSIYPALVASVLLGIAMTTYNASSMTLLQNSVPVDKQAKVLSAQAAFPDGASILSVAAAGVFIPIVSIRTIISVSAGITVLALITVLISRLQKIDVSLNEKDITV